MCSRLCAMREFTAGCIRSKTRSGCINAFWKNRQFPQGLKPTPLLPLNGAAKQAAEKLFSEGVILSRAKDLLFACPESKADPSDAHPNMRKYGACRGPRKIGATSG
jgi:hypothetical protein